VSRESFAAGVVISASHNPYHDNGVKLISPSGMKFPDGVEAELEESILSHKSRPRLTRINDRADQQSDLELHEDYLAGLRQTLLPGANLTRMKIVLDCANGAASTLAPELFRSLGPIVILMNSAPNGRNINAGCGSLHPEAMLRRVTDSGAALGVAFDGEATGKLKGNVIVSTTMANLGLERALEKSQLKLARTAVGDRYVLEEMQRIGANFGGEQSGHILFLDDAPTGDGMLTALKIASLVSIAGPLDTLVADLKVFPQKIVNVPVASKPPLELLPAVASMLGDAERSLGKTGRVVVRYSGTEPLARVMVEAESEKDVELWTRSLAKALRSAIGC
jgi:phosphoglucosamine mutase